MTPAPRRSAAAVLAAALVFSGCSGDQDGAGAADTGAGYVPGDGLVDVIPADQREDPVRLTGDLTDGDVIDTTDLLGSVVVVNLWYADCPPCRAEAEDLEQVWQDTRDDGVRFVGINVRDDRVRANVYEERFGISYPSILDRDRSAVLELRGQVAPNAIPSTLVLDAEGRVAARVSGIVTTSTLTGLIEDAAA